MHLLDLVRSASRALGFYKPLHRLYIYWKIRSRGIRVKFHPNGVYDLIRGEKAIRYNKWNLALMQADLFDHYFATGNPERRDGLLLVDYSQPSWRTLPHSGLKFFFHGMTEAESVTELYLQHAELQNGQVVFDMGACSGTQTVFFSKAVGPTGRVIAFEPDPINRETLLTNVKHHEAGNVTVLAAGVWSTSGKLAFFADGSEGASFVSENVHDAKRIEVPVLSPADVMREQGLTRLDFIKMDIEGAEMEVLASMTDILLRHRPRLVIEAHLIDHRSLAGPVVDLLEKLGYDCTVVSQAKSEYFGDCPLVCAKPREIRDVHSEVKRQTP